MIEFKNVKKKYNTFQYETSMHILPGHITGLIGKNGSGKSTTIKLLLGLIHADSGNISVFGKERLDVLDKEKIGVCLSDSFFSNYLKVNDIVSILAKSYSLFNRDFFVSQCEKLSIPFNKPIKEFSTGMKAKLKVLTALSHSSKLLVLDEPTSGLDVEARNEILDLLRKYMEEDVTRSILITSHISSDLESLCDDVYFIHEGKIILHEDTDVILDQYAILKVKNEQWNQMDKTYILNSVKTNYGYALMTNERQYYVENYPNIEIEKSGLDDLILMMTGGYQS